MDNGACSYRRFLAGDESAFDDIMNELFRPLVFFIDGYLHDVHSSEDIAIDVFSELVVHKNRYNFKFTLKTYLFMLGRSRAIDYLRHRKDINFSDISQEYDISEIQSDEKTLEEMILENERKRIINAAISGLQEDMRVVIHLIYFEDMTYDEAARVMKKKRKQIDNLLYRAKKELRIILGEDGKMLI